MGTLHTEPPNSRRFVEYADFSGGLCTKKAPHALERNQLAASVNCWYATGNAISKRPGSKAFGSVTGATGSGAAGKALATCRFNHLSYVLVLQGNTIYYGLQGGAVWTPIGTLNIACTTFSAAQQFDPGTQLDTVFIASEFDTPKAWQGPGHVLVSATALAGAVVPNNYTNTATITPRYVATLGLNSHLFYAGEPSAPGAVYISDPNYPNSFTTSITAASPYPGAYKPALIGFNDGVDGGSITGMAKLGPAMIVYKMAAIYAMIQEALFGDLVFGVVLVSSSVGCIAPKSIVPFDSFHVFLGIDGVYVTDGSSIRRISDNVPTFFDSTLSGFPAVIGDRSTAVGVRSGQRYLIFFSDTLGGPPNRGLWFDFAKLDADGFPTAGEISNMHVGGAQNLRGPADDGNVVWCDATMDRIGFFGLGFADFGAPISPVFTGKADLMRDVFPNDGALRAKNVDDLTLEISVPQQPGIAQSYIFTATVITDYLKYYTQNGNPIDVPPTGGGRWGDIWGAFQWSSGSQSTFAALKIDLPGGTTGNVIQLSVTESSVFPWTLLGAVLELTGTEPI